MYPNTFNRSVSRKLREGLKSPKFDARQWQDQDLLLFLKVMFTELGLMNKFKINITKLHSFLIKVYDSYNDVPFHNFRHCFCVAQMMYVIIWAVDLISKLGELEVLILMVSCICHDLDHPGYNNIYQINAHTELALRYNDISPLENHHCSVAFYLMEKKECNIFSSFDSDNYKIIREGIIRCILATDMARHNEILAEFNEIVSSFDYTSKSHTNL
ncbi:high affinity cGMP-specific 3',5'-cyclic phosphodiesterase 9A-like, partial [Trichogramma pretiosum]